MNRVDRSMDIEAMGKLLESLAARKEELKEDMKDMQEKLVKYMKNRQDMLTEHLKSIQEKIEIAQDEMKELRSMIDENFLTVRNRVEDIENIVSKVEENFQDKIVGLKKRKIHSPYTAQEKVNLIESEKK